LQKALSQDGSGFERKVFTGELKKVLTFSEYV